MIEAIAGMPDGTIGFRVWGKVTAADYDDVLIPALREAIDGLGHQSQALQVPEQVASEDARRERRLPGPGPGPRSRRSPSAIW